MEVVRGLVFLLDTTGSNNPHYWIFITNPDRNGHGLAVNFTDAENTRRWNTRTWAAGTQICPELTLAKDSTLRVDMARTFTARDLKASGAIAIGVADETTLMDLWCGVCFFAEYLPPQAAFVFEMGDLCDACPRRPF